LANSRIAPYLLGKNLLAFVAQWIEQEPSNLLVAGSIPAEGAENEIALLRVRSFERSLDIL